MLKSALREFKEIIKGIFFLGNISQPLCKVINSSFSMQHIPLDFLNNALKALVSIFLKKK
jgi:hypothetical protein